MSNSDTSGSNGDAECFFCKAARTKTFCGCRNDKCKGEYAVCLACLDSEDANCHQCGLQFQKHDAHTDSDLRSNPGTQTHSSNHTAPYGSESPVPLSDPGDKSYRLSGNDRHMIVDHLEDSLVLLRALPGDADMALSSPNSKHFPVQGSSTPPLQDSSKSRTQVSAPSEPRISQDQEFLDLELPTNAGMKPLLLKAMAMPLLMAILFLGYVLAREAASWQATKTMPELNHAFQARFQSNPEWHMEENAQSDPPKFRASVAVRGCMTSGQWSVNKKEAKKSALLSALQSSGHNCRSLVDFQQSTSTVTDLQLDLHGPRAAVGSDVPQIAKVLRSSEQTHSMPQTMVMLNEAFQQRFRVSPVWHVEDSMQDGRRIFRVSVLVRGQVPVVGEWSSSKAKAKRSALEKALSENSANQVPAYGV